MPNYLIMITSDGPGVGKTTASDYLSARLGYPYISTSTVIADKLAKDLGITVKDILEARKKDSEQYRKDLIDKGDEMIANKQYPSVIAFKEGVIIAEGIRLECEVIATQEYAKRNNKKLFHIHIEGDNHRGAEIIDNTQKEALRGLATHRVDNTKTRKTFFNSLKSIVEEIKLCKI